MTTDHSLVAELVQSGVLTPEEAERHPQRSAITRAVGTEPTVEVDAFSVDGQPGDLYLICSDGLNSMIEDEQIEAVLASEPDPEAACEHLIALANEAGGHDNITTIVVDVPVTYPHVHAVGPLGPQR